MASVMTFDDALTKGAATFILRVCSLNQKVNYKHQASFVSHKSNSRYSLNNVILYLWYSLNIRWREKCPFLFIYVLYIDTSLVWASLLYIQTTEAYTELWSFEQWSWYSYIYLKSPYQRNDALLLGILTSM